MPAPWFDPHHFGVLYGGFVGGGLGLLGAILGAGTAILAPQGKGRGFILRAFTFMELTGVVHLAIGLYAVYDRQPFDIWYPLVFIGVLFSLLFPMLRPIVRKRYEQVETKRMDAEAFGRA